VVNVITEFMLVIMLLMLMNLMYPLLDLTITFELDVIFIASEELLPLMLNLQQQDSLLIEIG
jgi:hypothetical protein